MSTTYHNNVGVECSREEYEGSSLHLEPSGSSNPGSPTEGDKFFNTAKQIWYLYNGENWKVTV